MSGPTDRQERWLYELAALLEVEEQQLLEDLAPVVQQAVEQLQELILELPAGSPSRDMSWLQAGPAVERLLGKINDTLRRELGATLTGLQRPVRAHATQLAAGDTDGPVLAAGELLKRATMADATIWAWLARASPSRWMVGIRDGIDRALRAGWARDAAGRELAREVAAAATSLITTAIETLTRTAIWDTATTEMEQTWDPERRWKYLAVLDPRTCPICLPWANQEGTRDELPEVPRHARCRCVVVPTG